MDVSNPDNETSSTSSNTGTYERDNNTMSINVPREVQQEIPFLVTHWLANYTNNSIISNVACQDREQMAIAKIRRATSDIASAFATLGAYGTSLRVSEVRPSITSPFLFHFILYTSTAHSVGLKSFYVFMNAWCFRSVFRLSIFHTHEVPVALVVVVSVVFKSAGS